MANCLPGGSESDQWGATRPMFLAGIEYRHSDLSARDWLHSAREVEKLTTSCTGGTTHVVFIITKGKQTLQEAALFSSELLYGSGEFPGRLRPHDKSAVVCLMNGAGHDEDIRHALEQARSRREDLRQITEPTSVIIGTTALSGITTEVTCQPLGGIGSSPRSVMALDWTGWGETVLVADEKDSWERSLDEPVRGSPSHATWKLIQHALAIDPDSTPHECIAPLRVAPASERAAVVWTKLAANVVINQLTAILDVPNGSLLPWLDKVIDLCNSDASYFWQTWDPSSLTVESLRRAMHGEASLAGDSQVLELALIGLSRELAYAILYDPVGLQIEPDSGQVDVKSPQHNKGRPSEEDLRQGALGILRKARAIAAATSLNISSMLSDVRRYRKHVCKSGQTPREVTENSYIGEYAAKRVLEVADGVTDGATLRKIAELVSTL